MFCITSIFIVFIAFAEFRQSIKKMNAASLSSRLKQRKGGEMLQNTSHIYFSTKYHKACHSGEEVRRQQANVSSVCCLCC